MDNDDQIVTESGKCIPDDFPLHFFHKEDIIELKMGNIYDPSKFWVIHLFEELDAFMEIIIKFYESNTEKCIPMAREHVVENLVCIVRRNNQYYRSIIVNLLPNVTNRVKVFLIDYGRIINVFKNELFYIHQKFCEVKRFAIRASLAKICPKKDNTMWSSEDTKAFMGLIDTCEGIQGKIMDINEKHKTLSLYLSKSTYAHKNIGNQTLNHILIENGVAKTCTNKPLGGGNFMNFEPIVKYVHHFPSFYALENGLVPSTLFDFNLLKNEVPLDYLYPNYFKFVDKD